MATLAAFLPRAQALGGQLGDGVLGDTQKLRFGSSTRPSSVVRFGNGAQSFAGGTASPCSAAFP